jgi:hypothetical protein
VQSRSCQITLVTGQLSHLNAKVAKEGLEPCDRKLSCPVLRGLGVSNDPRLPGVLLNISGVLRFNNRIAIVESSARHGG